MSLGGGRGAYAGQPLTFRCTRCKRGYDYKGEFADRVGTNVSTTGRWRRQKPGGMNYRNWLSVAFQYTCNDCGHTGWSRHPDVARRARHEHSEAWAEAVATLPEHERWRT